MGFQSGRHTGPVTPYKWQRTRGNGWRIGYGISGFLVAEGSGWSAAVGRKLYRDLEAGYWKRKKRAGNGTQET